LGSLLEDHEFMVNSRHAERVVDTGKYKVVGWSNDDVIEAIEDPSKDFNIGVQWHPEDLISFDKYSVSLFEAFFNSCKLYHQKKGQ
jgi:putative glutamine amidotransferase